ncbi:SCO4225 family membrane protein [Streptomyces sp. NPDC056374]|uniref:SCO4225 family membrane protein n=1 Tax=unclassified Streptomyces TaxID=2593676 RepID=UPI0035D8DBA0
MRDSRPRTLVRLTLANPASLVYLGLVAAAALPMVFASATADSSLEAVWILLITVPTRQAELAGRVADAGGDQLAQDVSLVLG